ncbi:MAG: PepSY-like domain-containing protein [Saprospiraceae bacterium]
MKYLVLATVLTFSFISTSCAQNKKSAPAAVQDAFKAKFPNLQKAKWDMEDDNEWEAEFKMNGHEMSANFKSDGTWLETETEIKTASLPQAVKDDITANFAGYEMEEASLVETPEMAAAYEVELEKGETTIEALFSAEGKLLKQKKEEEDDDEN